MHTWKRAAGDSGPGNGHRMPKEHDQDEGEDGDPLPWIISGTDAKAGLQEPREKPVPGAPGWAGTITGCLSLSSPGIRLCLDPGGTNLLDGWDGNAAGEPLTQR